MIFSLPHTENSFRNYKREIQLKFVKLLPIVLLFGLYACDETPNETVEQIVANINVTQIEAPASFIYAKSDSMFVASVEFDDSENIESVWATVKSVDGEITVSEETKLVDDGTIQNSGDEKTGDDIYSTKISMSKTYPNGNYVIDFFVSPTSGDSKKIGSHILSYDNGQNNYAPVISDLVLQSEASRGESFIFTVKAADSNGLNDIYQVYFKLYRPDGTLVDPQNGYGYFLMDDSGSEILGDATADDGIFSFKNSFGSSSQTGAWKFILQAVDRNGLVSNIITQELTVK
jgi:hypothetical protein